MNYFGCVKLFAFVCIIFFSTFSFSKDYRFEHIGISNGLPSSHVNKVFQEKSGFIWFATDAGASRFDGNNYISYQYNPSGEKSISNNYVIDVTEDNYNNIWLGTEYGVNMISSDGSIFIYNHSSEDFNTIPSNLIYSVFKDENGGLWVSTAKGVAKFDYENNKFIRFPIKNLDIDSTNVYTINESNHTLFFGTEKGLYYLNKNNNSIEYFKNKNDQRESFISSHKDGEGILWFGTEDQGVISLSPNLKEFQFYAFNSVNKVQSISSIGDDIYIGLLDEGITIYSKETGKTQKLKSSDDRYSILSDRIENIFVDKSKMLWVSTRKGVSFYSSLKNGSYIYKIKNNSYESSSNKSVNGLAYYDDSIFIATTDWVKYLDKNSETFKSIPIKIEGEEAVQAWSLSNDNFGKLWIAHEKGFSIYNSNDKSILNFSNSEGNIYGLPNNDFYTVLPINKNQAWLTGYDDVGVILFDINKGIIKHFINKPDNSYNSNGNYTIVKKNDGFGNLWLGTTNGLIRISAIDDKISFYDHNIENLRVNDISFDSNGNMWVSTSHMGFFKISNLNEEIVTIEDFGKIEGIPDLKLKNLLYVNGELWLTSVNKIFKYNIEDGTFKLYPSVITDTELVFTEGTIEKQGESIFIGSNKGLVRVDVNEIRTSDYEPDVHITQIINGNLDISHLINNNNNDAFSYDNNNIRFKFAVTDYNNHSNHLIKYKLIGFDKEWVVDTDIDNASYTNLDAGKYSFVIYGSNSDGKWSKKSAAFDFEIKQAWWIYALITMLLSIILVIILYFYSRHNQIKTLEKRANFDTLTGIPNRFNFNAKLQKLALNKNSFALMFIDLDDFKEVNDTMGHSTGDYLICLAARRLYDNLLTNEFACRLGGDEFAILIDNIDIQTYKDRIEDFKKLLNTDYLLDGKITKGSASIGVSTFPYDSKNKDDLIRNADIAMYESKRIGKNNISYFNEKMNNDFNEKADIRNLLHGAISNNELKVYYQPKVCVLSQKIFGLEALVRWNNKEKGFISPAVFIPESENNGTIHEIGEWVLRNACNQASIWNQEGILLGSVSVNISPAQFNDRLVSIIQKALSDFKLPPDKLELEITESVFINDVSSTLKILNEIKSIGVKIALDDFGTGYSSLSYLIDFPIDVLKIDRAFVKNINSNPKTELVVKNIFKIAEDLNFSVVVEGVETEQQLKVVSKYKCDLIQGYIYSPPVDADRTTELLKQSIIFPVSSF